MKPILKNKERGEKVRKARCSGSNYTCSFLQSSGFNLFQCQGKKTTLHQFTESQESGGLLDLKAKGVPQQRRKAHSLFPLEGDS